ncbi:hypothetical protein H4R35_007472 [Dimargaris xerosporica]|nr:hypothetical protein H4R35_007472 [Dimargaris xerosporica]
MKSVSIVSAMAVLAAMACLPLDSHAATLPVPAATVSTVRMVRRSNSDWQSYSGGPPSLVTDDSSTSGHTTGETNRGGTNPQPNDRATIFAHTIYNSAQSNVNDGVRRVVETVRDQYLAQPVADLNVRYTYTALFQTLLHRLRAIPDLYAALHYALAYVTLIHMDADENGDDAGNGYLNSAIDAMAITGNLLWRNFDQYYEEFEAAAQTAMEADLQRIDQA